MAGQVRRCENLLAACNDYPDVLICDAAGNFCSAQLQSPYFKSGLNYYDVSKPCDGSLCYLIIDSITTFLRNDTVRQAFGTRPDTPKFESCSNKVGSDFRRVHDGMIDSRLFVAGLLDTGIRVMIYVGTYDWICNFVGNERVFGSLDWTGLVDFRYQQENNKQLWEGGLWWESGPLRYVRVNAAGHRVPYDKPAEGLKLFKAWLNKEPLS